MCTVVSKRGQKHKINVRVIFRAEYLRYEDAADDPITDNPKPGLKSLEKPVDEWRGFMTTTGRRQTRLNPNKPHDFREERQPQIVFAQLYKDSQSVPEEW